MTVAQKFIICWTINSDLAVSDIDTNDVLNVYIGEYTENARPKEFDSIADAQKFISEKLIPFGNYNESDFFIISFPK